jgi:hypothetical protein
MPGPGGGVGSVPFAGKKPVARWDLPVIMAADGFEATIAYNLDRQVK